jgi:hypothetical protein
MKLLIDLQLFPSINYFKKLIESTHVRIEEYENFQKMSFRNRYLIYSSNGVAHLTVPIVGGREQKTLITDVEIDYSTDWRIKHWRSIRSAYSKAPFFDYYSSEIRDLLYSGENSLFNFNFFILKKLCNLLNVSLIISFTTGYYRTYDADILDYRNKLLPKSFQNDVDNWQPKYPQVFEDRYGFQPNLSILDLLFCEGPNARNLIEKSINKW